MAIDTIQQAQFIKDLRVRIQQNKDGGRPEYESITREEIAEFIKILRGNRAAQVVREHRSGPGRTPGPAISDDELKDLFT